MNNQLIGIYKNQKLFNLSVVSGQLSVVSCQLLIVSCQLSVVSYQLPITNYQLAITNYQLPITHYPLPITNFIKIIYTVFLNSTIIESNINKWNKIVSQP